MALAEEHFVGFDPRASPQQLPACPIFNGTAYVIWFETWSFSFLAYGLHRITGISYLVAYQGFDLCGNMKKFPPSDVDFQTFSFGGTHDAGPFETLTTFDVWLAAARHRAQRFNLPAPGTIQFTDLFHQAAGYRA